MNRSPLKLPAALATAAVLLLPLAGCGGEDKAAASATLDPVRAAFVKQVTPICEKLQQDITAVTATFQADPSAKKFRESLQQASTVILAAIREIEQVDAPESLTTRVDAMLTSLDKAARRLPKLTPEDAERSVDPFAESDPYARDLGLDACSGGS